MTQPHASSRLALFQNREDLRVCKSLFLHHLLLAYPTPEKSIFQPNLFSEGLHFNGRLRDECLNEHLFDGLADARHIIEAWRQDYNIKRPHTALGGLAPVVYANAHYRSGSLALIDGAARRTLHATHNQARKANRLSN